MKEIIMFYGASCPSCITLMPLVDKINEHGKIHIEKLETWNHPENEQKRNEYTDLFTKNAEGTQSCHLSWIWSENVSYATPAKKN